MISREGRVFSITPTKKKFFYYFKEKEFGVFVPITKKENFLSPPTKEFLSQPQKEGFLSQSLQWRVKFFYEDYKKRDKRGEEWTSYLIRHNVS